MLGLKFFFTAIRIGFAHPEYIFLEPDMETLFSNVTLIREGGRESERLFAVGVTVGSPRSERPASLEGVELGTHYDYRLGVNGTLSPVLFPAAADFASFQFFLNSDELPEGLEAFEASSSPLPGFPTFLPPITNATFRSTIIRIIDTDCELFY